MASSFSPGPPVASLPIIRNEKNDKREVEVCVERIRSGLFCIHSQWEKPQCKTRSSEDLCSNDDSITGSKKSDEKPTFSSFTFQVKSPTFVGKSDDSSIVKPVFGQPSASHSIFGKKAAPPKAPPSTLFGQDEPAASTSLFGKPVPLTMAFGQAAPAAPSFKFGSSSPQTFFGSQTVDSVSSTRENCANDTADKPSGTHNQQVVYVADFTIDGQSYNLKTSFTKSATKIFGSLELTQVETKSINETEETISDGVRDESNPSNGTPAEDLNNQLRPMAVWANLNGAMTKILPLKKSLNSDHQWISENFDGSFAYSERLFSVDEWKPWKSLACLLWIEFETFSSGEKNVLKQLSDMYVQQNHCDVKFTFKGDQQVGGHVNILVARSSVFAAMFEHDMKEAATGEVAIEDVKLDIFKQLLHYIYSGRLLTPLTEAIAQPLFVAADKYEINDLKQECVSFLLSCVRVDNAINFLVWAHLHSVDELHQVVLSFMALHGKEVCHLKEWDDLTKNYPDLCILATRRIVDCVDPLNR